MALLLPTPQPIECLVYQATRAHMEALGVGESFTATVSRTIFGFQILAHGDPSEDEPCPTPP